MEYRTLITNGTVVDGTGKPAFKADVRIRAGRIAEIGPDLQSGDGERVFDASGCYVTPGFIECHNHWDAAVWWSPNMEPFPGYGVTTSINGNCGFSLAPLPQGETGRDDIVDIFNFFEDIPEVPMKTMIAWDWHKWSEYKASHERNVRTPVNFGSYCGHIPIRLCVMGEAAWERAATPEEIARMCALLEDALAAGAMGMSSNQLDHDKHDRPLPTQLADDAEYLALLDVLARYPGATFQLIIDNWMHMTATRVVERIGALCKQAGVTFQWAGLPTLDFQQEAAAEQWKLHEDFKAEGLPFWTGFTHVQYMFSVDFKRTLIFAQLGLQPWQDIVEIKDDAAKLEMLADPEWRARAREAWDAGFSNNAFTPQSVFLRESENGAGPVGVKLEVFMEQEGIAHPSDALADWVIRNGADSVALQDGWARVHDTIVRLLKDPRSVANVSDAGAHGKMFCGAGDNALLLTEYVRDRKDLTIEQGINALTGRQAEFFGLDDRGVLAPGMAADVCVFDLGEIERRDEEKLWDIPDGEGGRTYRYVRAAAPMRLTLVNGIPTFDNGVFTGKFPGRFIGPEHHFEQAIAAE
ncbi:amidohydrolase [Novosphingobium sp. PC22D]|uniref:N-acyl-D-amino-acid deacylase family protein n=1 Tax=Novosphingobium sp. PC22D TaxID=1962403 RepID=UPI000BF0C72B|nr:amidohydrolase family protein [Novosphingobium sp. PC22D]PEQ13633.1 amidohydrolase [Novosphingobium sp. PC22D]